MQVSSHRCSIGPCFRGCEEEESQVRPPPDTSHTSSPGRRGSDDHSYRSSQMSNASWMMDRSLSFLAAAEVAGVAGSIADSPLFLSGLLIAWMGGLRAASNCRREGWGLVLCAWLQGDAMVGTLLIWFVIVADCGDASWKKNTINFLWLCKNCEEKLCNGKQIRSCAVLTIEGLQPNS